MVIIDAKHKLIFIENPKCASSTILAALTEVLGTNYIRKHVLPHAAHITSRQAQEKFGPEIWAEYLKVTTSRDPFSRFRSAITSTHHWRYGNFRSNEGIIDHLKNNVGCPYCIPQEEFTDGMDVILRVDTLQQDFDALCVRLGVPSTTLLVKNISSKTTSQAETERIERLYEVRGFTAL